MFAYIVRRVVLTLPVLAGVSILTFLLTHAVPGNPAKLLAGQHATQAQVEVYVQRYGLNQPLPTQYLDYMNGLFHGNLGTSLTTQRPVTSDLALYLPATAELVIAALILTVCIGVPLGVVSGVWSKTWVDHVVRLGSVGGAAIPAFWLGMILQVVFFERLHLLPLSGQFDLLTTPPQRVTGMGVVDAMLSGNPGVSGDALLHLLLPAVTLAAGGIALVARMSRGAVIETLGSDFVRMARAKGMREVRVVLAHALPNALTSTVTVLGLEVGTLLAGTFLVESVFSWPGIGLYAVQAIGNRDYPAIMGVTLIIAFAYVFANLLVDLIYVWIDPRLRYARR